MGGALFKRVDFSLTCPASRAEGLEVGFLYIRQTLVKKDAEQDWPRLPFAPTFAKPLANNLLGRR